MKCPKCGMDMMLDAWNGWQWVCLHCGNNGRLATDDEIAKYEENYTKIKKE